MVREAMLVKDIADELAIRDTTVRSHLHSIYTKTGTSGQIELLHRLCAPGSGVQAETPVRPAEEKKGHAPTAQSRNMKGMVDHAAVFGRHVTSDFNALDR